MLFDEKDLSVFDNPDSRSYFKEILQSYYSQNYRAIKIIMDYPIIMDIVRENQNIFQSFLLVCQISSFLLLQPHG